MLSNKDDKKQPGRGRSRLSIEFGKGFSGKRYEGRKNSTELTRALGINHNVTMKPGINNGNSVKPISPAYLPPPHLVMPQQNQFNGKSCYVHQEVDIIKVNQAKNKVHMKGFVHFLWIQDAIDYSRNQVVLDSSTGQPLRGPGLILHLQEHCGYTIQDRVADRVVLLFPLNDDKCFVPVPTRKCTPFALYNGMEHEELDVHKTLFYPDRGVVHVTYAFAGWVSQPMTTFRFPFDRQGVKLELLTSTQHFSDYQNHLQFTVNPPPGIVTHFHFLLDESQSKLITPVEVQLGVHLLDEWILGPDPEHLECLDFTRSQPYSPFPTLVIPFERKAKGYLYRIFLPAYLLVLFALSSFVLEQQQQLDQASNNENISYYTGVLFARTTIVMICFVASLLLRFGVARNMPYFQGMTLLDHYFLANFILFALIEFFNIIAHSVNSKSVTTKSTSFSSPQHLRSSPALAFELSCLCLILVTWSVCHVLLMYKQHTDFVRGKWEDVILRCKTAVTSSTAGAGLPSSKANGKHRIYPLARSTHSPPPQPYTTSELPHHHNSALIDAMLDPQGHKLSQRHPHNYYRYRPDHHRIRRTNSFSYYEGDNFLLGRGTGSFRSVNGGQKSHRSAHTPRGKRKNKESPSLLEQIVRANSAKSVFEA